MRHWGRTSWATIQFLKPLLFDYVFLTRGDTLKVRDTLMERDILLSCSREHRRQAWLDEWVGQLFTNWTMT